MSSPTADVSVRIAWADDAAAIAALQVRAWRDGVRRAGAARGAARRRRRRGRGLARVAGGPADARNRVLVALERNRVVGFAITGPAADPDCDPVSDGELPELTLDPDERGRGHGSRLLQAAVDTHAGRPVHPRRDLGDADDDALRAFLTEAGWAPDTAHRELALDGEGGHPRQAGPPAHAALLTRRASGPVRT